MILLLLLKFFTLSKKELLYQFSNSDAKRHIAVYFSCRLHRGATNERFNNQTHTHLMTVQTSEADHLLILRLNEVATKEKNKRTKTLID